MGCVICAMCWVSDVGFGVLYLFRGSLLRAVEVWVSVLVVGLMSCWCCLV